MKSMFSLFTEDPKRSFAWSLVMVVFFFSAATVHFSNTIEYADPMLATAVQTTLDTNFDGEMEVIIMEDFDTEHYVYEYYLRESDDKVKKINVRAQEARTLHERVKTGDRVRVKGKANAKNEIEASTVEVLSAAKQDEFVTIEDFEDLPLITTNERRVVTILVNFADKNVGTSISGATSLMYTGANNVDKKFRDTSWNQVGLKPDTDGDGKPDIFGPFTISIPSTSDSCDIYKWANEANALAQATGVDLSKYQHRLYIVPTHSKCGWAGVANMGCSQYCNAWVNHPSLYVTAHELGHNLGMHHAGTDPENDGVTNSVYGDSSDIMGSGSTGFNAPHDDNIGWAKIFRQKTVTVTGSGEYTLAPMSANPATTLYPQILKIPKKGETGVYYYVSFRQSVGFDTGINTAFTGGVSIHRNLGAQTSLIRTLSATTPTWTDPLGSGLKITQLERATDGSSVRVAITNESACTPGTPTATLSPSTVTSLTGGTASFSLSVRNTDSSCQNTTFTPSVSGITGTFSPSSATIESGMTQSFTLTTSNIQSGETKFIVTVADTDGRAPAHTNVTVSGSIIVDGVAPSAPSDLQGTVTKQGAVSLTWKASTDNIGVTGYDVLRNGTLIRTVTTLSFSEKPIAGTYTYTVRARDAANNVSAESNKTAPLTISPKGNQNTGKPNAR